MKAQGNREDSIVRLRTDVMTDKILVWVASVGRESELTSEAHLYFFDRYRRLADYHRKRGHQTKARQLQSKADEHYRICDGGGPPYAAAMAMPRPRQWLTTEAVGRHMNGSDDAA